MKKLFIFGLVLLLFSSFVSAANANESISFAYKLDFNSASQIDNLSNFEAGTISGATFNNSVFKDVADYTWSGANDELNLTFITLDGLANFTLTIWATWDNVAARLYSIYTESDDGGPDTLTWWYDGRGGQNKWAIFVPTVGGACNIDIAVTPFSGGNTFAYYELRYNGSGLRFMINDTIIGEDSTACSGLVDISGFSGGGKLGNSEVALDTQWAFNLDEFYGWLNYSFTDEDHDGAYLTGVGSFVPLFVPPTFFELTLRNIYNSTLLNVFTANITNSSNPTGTTIHTTNGTIVYPFGQIVNITIFNITGVEGIYFNQTLVNIDTDINKRADTWQSVLVLDAQEKISNVSAGAFNATVLGSFPQFNVSNSSNFTTFLLNTGIYNVTGISNFTFNSIGSFTVVSLQQVNGTLFFGNNQLNISAVNNITDAAINIFSVDVFLGDLLIETLLTTSGLVQYIAPNGTYFFDISATGFASTSSFVDMQNTSQNHTFRMFQRDSIFINIFNQTDGVRIFEEITISFILGAVQTQNVTTTSSFFATNLTAGNYTISFVGENYSKVSYEVVVVAGSNQSLNAYLPHIGITDQVIFEILDVSSGSVIEGVSIAISRFIEDALTQFLVIFTDVTGRAAFKFEEDTEYQFVLTKDGFVTKTFVLNPVLFNEYTTKMERTTGQENTIDYSGVNVLFNPQQFFNNQNHNITFQFISPTGTFDTYGFNVTWKNTVLSGNGINANGQIFTTNLSISNAGFSELVTMTYFYKTTFGEEKVFSYTFTVITFGTNNNTMLANRNQTYGLGVFERTVFATVWAVFVGGAAATAGGAPAAAMAGIFIFAIFAYIGFLEFWIAIIPIVILVLVLAWGKT